MSDFGMYKMKLILKKIIPKSLVSLYHYLWAAGSAFCYGYPTRDMVVIGVTGTKGKTTAANFIWSVLTAAGFKTGLIGTANIRIGAEERLNPYHMTMPGRAVLQSQLSKMRKSGCTHCVIETTSEGVKQWRHLGIFYDICVFMNLSEEHLEAHGGKMENYMRAKGKIFSALKNFPKKIIAGKPAQKTIIVNFDSPYKSYYLGFWAEKKMTFGLQRGAEVRGTDIVSDLEKGASFKVDQEEFIVNLPGEFNVVNALSAIAVAKSLDVPASFIRRGLKAVTQVPGRMEKISAGHGFSVFVDYAHEKLSLGAILDEAENHTRKNDGRTILLLGAEGGGRDRAKRREMGKMAAGKADFVIISNVDPYDDDPKEILKDIAASAEACGKIPGKDMFVIEDRREGIAKALSIARKNDIVLITGKGAEQSMIIGGKSIPWDDRVVVKDELNKLD